MIDINVPDNWAIVIGIHRLTCGFPYKMPVMWNFCSYCDVIMATALEIWSKIPCDILLNLLLELGFITVKCGKHMDYKLWPDNPNICRYVKQPKRNNPQLNAQWWLFPLKVFSSQQYLLDNWVIKIGNKHKQSHRQSGIMPFSTQPVISMSWRCFLHQSSKHPGTWCRFIWKSSICMLMENLHMATHTSRESRDIVLIYEMCKSSFVRLNRQ